MPYLDIRISQQPSKEITEKVVTSLMDHTTNILGKKPEVTSIGVSFISPETWFIGGTPVSQQAMTTFYLDIKITEGTNTKQEKAQYVKAVFADMETILGKVAPASYIVLHDIRADAWGFEGKTQEYRFIQAQSL